MPRLRHYDHLNTARFVTFSCYRRHRFLVTEAVISVFLDVLKRLRERHKLRLLGYVVMPEHVHLVIHPPDSLRIGPVIGELKSKSGSRIIAARLLEFPDNCRVQKNGCERWAFWQPRCYDHNCRTPEAVFEKITYCHNNPVKRGLVSEPGEWRWSSYNWYAGSQGVPLAMDLVEWRGVDETER